MKTETLEVTVLSDNKELQTNLEKENITELVIKDLKTKYSGLEIKGMDDVEGYKAVDEARKEVKRIRVMAEKIVKQETDKAYQAHKSAVADGKKIVVRFTDIEDSLEKKQAVIDDEKKRIEAIAAEEKKAKNTQRIKDLQAFNYQGDLMVIEFLSDEQFAEKLSTAKTEYEAIQAKVAEEKRIAQVEAERLEKQRLDQEAREKELQLLEKERIEAAAKIKAEQDAKEKEIADREAKLKAAEENIENERQAAVNRIFREEEIEKAKIAAAAKALADAEEKRIAAIEKDKKEYLRLEALKPDKEKLLAFSTLVITLPSDNLSMDDLKSIEAKKIYADAIGLLTKVSRFIDDYCGTI